MHLRRRGFGVALAWLAAGLVAPAASQETGPEATAEAVVRELYDLVTFPAGTTPDWDRARELFLPEAVVVLRTSRTATTVFDVEGWIQDFVTFIEQWDIMRSGFSERIVRWHATEYRDMAQVWVLYEPSIPGRAAPPQEGVDSFALVRRDGRWLIASVVNEAVTPDHPVPEVLRER